MAPRRDAYDIVRDFFREGPPASRNAGFDAYQDPRFARAVRIYQYLCSVRDELVELLQGGEELGVEVTEEPERVVVRIRYERGQIRRTAYLKPAEWELLRTEPALARFFAERGAPAAL
jgi:hypothetical protein